MFNLLAPSFLSKHRISICKACSSYDPKLVRCKKCGCFVAIKTKLQGEKCPLEKW